MYGYTVSMNRMQAPSSFPSFEGALVPGLEGSKPSETAAVSWLLLDLNSYFASCEQQLDPSLRGKPVGIIPVLAETTSCLSMSYEAKAKGVKMGMRLSDVRRLCPDIIFRQARPSVYVEIHHEILKAVESCVPISSVLSIDEVACELTGSQRRLPVAIALAKHMKDEVRRQVGDCLKSSVGLAPNPMLAKVASDFQKPDGLTVFLKELLPAALYSLPLRALPGVGPKMEKRILSCGITSMESLCSTSKEEMRRIWGGICGERFHEWLRGGLPELPKTQTRSMSHQHVLPPEKRSREAAWIVVQGLLDRLARRLRKEKVFTKRLTLSIRPLQGESWEETAKLDETQDTIELFRVMIRLWNATPPTLRPLLVSVTASDLIQSDEHQFSLFENPRRTALSHALDSIQTIYGKESVTFASLLESGGSGGAAIAFKRVPGADEF